MTTASMDRPHVRPTRAYLAGFGTAGSLLAGAALLFVLASALVAFRGWPQVGDQPAPISVVISRSRSHLAGGYSATTRRVSAAVAAARAGAPIALGAAGGLAVAAAGRGTGGGTVASGGSGGAPVSAGG